MNFPQLKLSQKGVLLVAVPLCLLCVFYFGVKLRLNAVRQQMTEVEKRMAIVSNINNVELKAYFAFQSLMQLKLHGKVKERIALNSFLDKLQRDTTRLIQVMRDDDHNPIAATRIEQTFRTFMVAFKQSDFNPNPENEVGSILRSIDENQKFMNSAGVFFQVLSDVAFVEQGAVDDSRNRLQTSRRDLETWVDIVVLTTLAITLFTSVQFFRSTVKRIMTLKENAWRFGEGKMLLDKVGGSDEIGEVDRVFHEMAATIRSAQERDSYMMKLLQESKERLNVVLNNLPIAVIVTDSAGIIDSVNPAAVTLFEYAPEELKNKPIEILFPARNKDVPLLEQLQDVTAVQLEALGKNQDAIFTEVQKKNFAGADGERVLIAALDVSERHNLEQLTKDFYAMVSHDIRSPLNAIDGTLEIALSKKYGSVSQELGDRLSGARRNIAQLLELVNKLLEIEKLEGAMMLALEEVDLAKTVQTAVDLLKQHAESKTVALDTECAKLTIEGDRQYILQVVSNLVENAIKYSPSGGHVLIKVMKVGGQAELTVRDDGPGVPKDMRTAIFERFRQIPYSAPGQKGFGLGLAICKQIVEKHGGKIGIRDASGGSGKGSEFWVRFNLRGSELG